MSLRMQQTIDWEALGTVVGALLAGIAGIITVVDKLGDDQKKSSLERTSQAIDAAFQLIEELRLENARQRAEIDRQRAEIDRYRSIVDSIQK